MTDGIIQKVFKECLLHNTFRLSNGNQVISDKDIWKLQQELIEEIKKKADSYYCFPYNKQPKIIELDKLIGDNQE